MSTVAGNNSSIISLNYDKIFADIVHYSALYNAKGLPDSDAEFPLYALSGDNSDSDNGETKELVSRSSAWHDYVKFNYSSPNNIQKLIITTEFVKVYFYRHPINNGKPLYNSGMYYLNKAVNIRRTKENNLRLSKILDSFKENTDNLLHYKIYGSPFKCLLKPWVASNIEEIFIDEALLIYNSMFKNSMASSQITPEWIRGYILKIFGVPNINDFKHRYKRLKHITVVRDLNKVYSLYSNTSPTTETKDYKHHFFTWLREQNIGVSLILNNNDDTDKDGLTFRSYYRFDKEELAPYSRELIRQYNRKLAKDTDNQGSGSKQETELLLDAFAEKHKINGARAIATQLTMIFRDDTEVDIRSEFTEKGYADYFDWRR